MIESAKKVQADLIKIVSLKPAFSMTTDDDSKSKSKSGDETEQPSKSSQQIRKMEQLRKPTEEPRKPKRKQQPNRRLDEFLCKKSVNEFQAIAVLSQNQKLKDYLQQTEKQMEEFTEKAMFLLRNALQQNIKLKENTTKLQITHSEPPNPPKPQEENFQAKNQLSLLVKKHQQNKIAKKLQSEQLLFDKNRRLKRQLFYESNCCFKVAVPPWPLLLNTYQPVELVYRSDRFELYKGLNLRNLQNVAIKLYYVKSEAVRKAAQREYTIHKRVQCHPNILQCLDYFTLQSDKCGLIFEWAQYNLEQFAGTMTEEQISAVTKQLCQVIRHLKGQQVIHRAIKTDNIYVVGDQVKLNNFSHALEGLQGLLTVEKLNQNEKHIPPECQYTQAITDKFDIWSLGVVILGCKMRIKNMAKGQMKKLCENYQQPTMKMANSCLSQAHSRPTIEGLLKTFRK